MKTVRKNIFETNSSSCHSITFCGEKSDDVINTYLLLKKSFDFNGSSLTTMQDKFSYAFACFLDVLDMQCAGDMYTELFSADEAVRKFLNERLGFVFEDKLPNSEEDLWDAYLSSGKLRELDIPDNLIDKYQSRFKRVIDNVIEAFDRKDIDVCFEDGEDYIIEKNHQNHWEKLITKYQSRIDHSSCPKEDSDAFKLGSMFYTPDELVRWVMDPHTGVHLDWDN